MAGIEVAQNYGTRKLDRRSDAYSHLQADTFTVTRRRLKVAGQQAHQDMPGVSAQRFLARSNPTLTAPTIKINARQQTLKEAADLNRLYALRRS